jgi:titin
MLAALGARTGPPMPRKQTTMNLKNIARRATLIVAVTASLAAAGEARADGILAVHGPSVGNVLGTTIAPAAPRSPTARPRNSAVRLTWRAPSHTGGATIDKYRVQRRAGTMGHWRTIATPSVLRYRASGLKNGTRYYFRFAAHNAAGWSTSSKIVSAIPRTKPSAPRSLVASAGDGSVKLTWLAPSSNGGATVDKYRVQRRAGASGLWKTVATSTTHSQLAGGLSNGIRYFFRVAAHNAAGWSVPSGAVSSVPRTVPSEPRSLVAKPGDNSVKLTWLAPSSSGGSPIDKYRVQRAIPGGPWEDRASPTTTSYTDNGLTNGQGAWYRVLAHNKVGWGPVSTTVTGVASTVPSAPTTLWASAGNLSISLAFGMPVSNGGSTIDSFKVQRATSAGGPWTDFDTTSGTPYVAKGLTAGVHYYFRVAAHNLAGYGPYSPVHDAVPYTVPSAPGPPQFTPTWPDGSVIVSWAASSTNGGSPIDFYRLEMTTGGGPWVAAGTTGGLGHTVPGLKPGNTYAFRVIAHNMAGFGSPSVVMSYKVPAKPPSEPTACSASRVVKNGAESIKIAWSPPNSDGGAPILFYRITVRRADNLATHTETYVWSPGTNVDVDGPFQPNLAYEVVISAYNNVGSGQTCSTWA